MKKPTLEDFNLTEKSKDVYDEQIAKYNKVCEKVNQACYKRNNKVILICAIPTIILFILMIVFWSNANDTGEGIGVLFLFATSIAYPCIIAKLFYIGDGDSDFERDKRNKFKNSLGLITDKYRYVNKALEENLQKYDAAVREFKDYQQKISVEFWENLNGYEFEQEVANLYRKMGYSAQVTPFSGDGGIDIILQKGTERIAVQCKHHKSKVGANDVRALQGVVYNNYYSYGIFVSLNGFSPKVGHEVSSGRIKIELIQLNDLISMEQMLYTNIDKHETNPVDSPNTGLPSEEYKELSDKQQNSKLNLKSNILLLTERKEKVEKLITIVKIGTTVTHKNFGEGTVIWIWYDKKYQNDCASTQRSSTTLGLNYGKKYIKVRFAVGEKQFVFPDAFLNGFLELK